MFSFLCSFRIMPMLLLGIIPLTVGCSQEIPAPTCMASGKLLINGRPAPGACVRFHAIQSSGAQELPEATWCEEDGTYSLGLPNPGQYVITFYWPSITIEEGEEIEGRDRLGMRFKDPRESKQKVSVQAGINQLDPIEVNAIVSHS